MTFEQAWCESRPAARRKMPSPARADLQGAFFQVQERGEHLRRRILALDFEWRSGVPSQQRIQSGSREIAVLFEHYEVLDQLGECDLCFQHVLLRNASR